MAKSRAQHTAGAVAVLLITLAIVGMINYLSFRHYKRWDWSSQQAFSLSPRTLSVLKNLREPIHIYVFLARGEAQYAEVDEMLETYKSHSPQLTVHHVDPDRDRAKFELLAQRFGLFAVQSDAGVLSAVPIVVEAGERRWKVERSDLVAEDFEAFDESTGPKLDVQTERALTGALIQVMEAQTVTLCLTQGHGEWALGGGEGRSLDHVKDELRWQKVALKALDLGEDLSDCNALLVLGPQRALQKQEAEVLDAWISKGGSVLFALDPNLEHQRVLPTGLEELFAKRALKVGSDLVLELDPRRLLTTNPIDAFVVTDFGDHEVTDAIRRRGGGVVMAVARSVGSENPNGAAVIVRATAQGFATQRLSELEGTTDIKLKEGDQKGPVPLALLWEDSAASAVAHNNSPRGRIALFGDSDWLQPAFFGEASFANRDLLNAAVGWLTHRSALIDIAPRKTNARAVIMSEEDLSNVAFRLLVLMPLTLLLVALLVWWMRRN